MLVIAAGSGRNLIDVIKGPNFAGTRPILVSREHELENRGQCRVFKRA